MKALILIPAAVAVAWIYTFKKEDQLRKLEQLDHGEETRCS